MPYVIRKYGDKWVIMKEKAPDHWVIDSHHDTREKAAAAMRVKQGVEHGWKPTGKKRS